MPFSRQSDRRSILGRWPTASVCTSIIALSFGILPLSSCNSQSTHLAYVTSGANGIFAFRIRNGNGVITNVFTSPFLPADSVFGLVVHPSNRFAFVANQADGTISLLDIDLDSGALTEKLPRTAAGLSPGPMILSPDGSFLFVADQGLNQVLVFSVGANGSLSQVSSAPVGATPSSLTLASSGFLFVPVPVFSSIYVFTVSSGSITQVCSGPGPICSPFKVADGLAAVATDPMGKFLYVPNPSTNTVSGFVIQPGGSLASVPGVNFPTGTGPTAATVDPTGKYLYVANFGTTTVSEFTIDSNTGNLTAFAAPTQGVGSNPEFIMFDPDNKFVYVANLGSRTISQFSLNSNGTFRSTGNTMALGSVPRALAFTK